MERFFHLLFGQILQELPSHVEASTADDHFGVSLGPDLIQRTLEEMSDMLRVERSADRTHRPYRGHLARGLKHGRAPQRVTDQDRRRVECRLHGVQRRR